jgi:hypothetical protein
MEFRRWRATSWRGCYLCELAPCRPTALTTITCQQSDRRLTTRLYPCPFGDGVRSVRTVESMTWWHDERVTQNVSSSTSQLQTRAKRSLRPYSCSRPKADRAPAVAGLLRSDERVEHELPDLLPHSGRRPRSLRPKAASREGTFDKLLGLRVRAVGDRPVDAHHDGLDVVVPPAKTYATVADWGRA